MPIKHLSVVPGVIFSGVFVGSSFGFLGFGFFSVMTVGTDSFPLP